MHGWLAGWHFAAQLLHLSGCCAPLHLPLRVGHGKHVTRRQFTWTARCVARFECKQVSAGGFFHFQCTCRLSGNAHQPQQVIQVLPLRLCHCRRGQRLLQVGRVLEVWWQRVQGRLERAI